jgi:hypothetical protein
MQLSAGGNGNGGGADSNISNFSTNNNKQSGAMYIGVATPSGAKEQGIRKVTQAHAQSLGEQPQQEYGKRPTPMVESALGPIGLRKKKNGVGRRARASLSPCFDCARHNVRRKWSK